MFFNFIKWILKASPFFIWFLINITIFIFFLVMFFDEFEWDTTIFHSIFLANEGFIIGSLLLFALVFLVFIFTRKTFKQAIGYAIILMFFNIIIITTHLYYRAALIKTFNAWQQTQNIPPIKG